MTKVSELISRYDEKKVRSILAAGKNVPATQSIAKKLELGLALQLTSDGRMDDVVTLLAAGNNDAAKFLGNPYLKDWISNVKMMNKKKNPYSLLFKKYYSKHYSDGWLAQQLAVAKGNGAAKGVATELEKLLMKKWLKNRNRGNSGMDVFKRLGLKQEGINMLDSPVWDTWVSYLVKLDSREKSEKEKQLGYTGLMMLESGVKIGKEEEHELTVSALMKRYKREKKEKEDELVLLVLRKEFADDILEKWFAAATSDTGKKRGETLEAALKRKKSAVTPKESARTPKGLRKRPGEDSGEAPAMSKRQRNDDGQ